MNYSNNYDFNSNQEPLDLWAVNDADLDSFMDDENLITEEEYLENRLAEEIRKNDELEAEIEKLQTRLELGTDVVLLGDKIIRELAAKVQQLESNLVLAGETINAADEYIQELEANQVTIVTIELGV